MTLGADRRCDWMMVIITLIAVIFAEETYKKTEV